MANQPGVDRGERRGIAVHDVRGPLALVSRPVIALGPASEDVVMERVEGLRNAAERARPSDGELSVHELLGELRVSELREAVVIPAKVRPSSLAQVPGQPLATVDADLDGEREPGLEAGADEAEERMQVVL